MTAPILVPAWPSVLRAGLRVRVALEHGGYADGTITGYESPRRGMVAVQWDGGTGEVTRDPATLLLDLRNLAVMDAVQRAMFAKHYADGEADASCPRFLPFGDGTLCSWQLVGEDGRCIVFASNDGDVHVPTLRHGMSRLEALAACAAAVLTPRTTT